LGPREITKSPVVNDGFVREGVEKIFFGYGFRDGRVRWLVYDRLSPRSRAVGWPVDGRAVLLEMEGFA
jgi:hypothetical protein